MCTYKLRIGELQERLLALQDEWRSACSEHAALRSKEAGLLLCLAQCGSSVAAIKHALYTGEELHSSGSSSSGDDSPSAGLPLRESLLQQLRDKEALVQDLISRLGTAGRYDHLYTSRILTGLRAHPERIEQLCAMPLPARLAALADAARRFGLLLGRYDAEQCSTRQELDALVDQCIEANLARGLLERQRKNLELANVNMVTGQPEPMPPQFCQHVAKAIAATPEQRRLLAAAWQHVKALREAELARHKALSARLLVLQHQHEAELAWFAQEAQQLFAMLQQRRGAPAPHAQPPGSSVPAASGLSLSGGSTATAATAALLQPGGAQHCYDSDGSDALASPSPAVAACGADALIRLLCSSPELLSDAPTPEEAELLDGMSAAMSQISLLHFSMACTFYNTLSRRQLAQAVIASFPFAPDAPSICEAFEAMQWGGDC